MSLETLICLCNSLFSSFLYYGLIAWGLTCDTYLSLLFRLQKKIFRCIKIQPSTAPSTPLFHSMKIVKLKDMLHLRMLSFIYKTINKLSPALFHEYFVPDSSIHRFGTR